MLPKCLLGVFFLGLGLVSLTSSQGPPNCNSPQGNCACQTDQGMIDLSSLDSGDPYNPTFSNEPDQGGTDTFSYNPCSGFNNGDCYNVAVCQQRGDDGSTFACGDADGPTWSTDPTYGLTISYTSYGNDGVTRTSNVALTCDMNQEGVLSVLGETYPGSATYEMTLTTKYACIGTPPGPGPNPGRKGGGISVGSVMCIILVVLILVYLIAGSAFNFAGRGSRGVEVIPNHLFWAGFPGLVKDGAMFIVHKVKGGGGSYESF